MQIVADAAPQGLPTYQIADRMAEERLAQRTLN